MRNVSSAHAWLIRLVLLAGLAGGGCGALETPSPADGVVAGAAAPVWPAPPAQPRIRYARSISGPRDLGLRRPLLRRLVDLFTAGGPGHFVRPTGVAERAGVLYVADPGARALWILDPPQDRFAQVTRVGDEALVSPVAVAPGEAGAVYLADSVLRKVYLLDRAGRLIRVAAQGDLARPAGLAYDAASRRLYVADSAAQRIGVYGPDGALLQRWGANGDGNGEFNYPTYLALGADGTLLVTDALNFRVQAFDRGGRFLWKIGRHGDGSGDFAAPKGAALDRAGHVYVVDALFDAVQVFAPDGAFLIAFGERGTAPGRLWLPGGIFVAPGGRIYVADSYNQRVQVFERLPDAGSGEGK